MTSIQKFILTLFFIVFALYSAYEVFEELTDFSDGESLAQAWVEIGIVIMSLAGLLYFAYIIAVQAKEKIKLKDNLADVRKQLESSNIRLQDGKKEYQKVIQWQFSEWGLSPSEQEVALLMLKGLSVKEISASRNTHEKTVRKQASAIYEKSGLGGRHELSAWFFEDLL
ncbi:helix-turn-helix transcriptional regulator [Cocleimonas sp. KMM 6892]|jgi:DNA-binding CsgD family transcriptional regulator|uniref:helix-turn-helix transcriptional regulator n=1 Tax=unclassified Cocleimonas TaxID=2639732 RepID=UPI002DBE07CF|nr:MULTISPECIES: helix-turn-helix transcriptional regulator [unclassified Cocleimonas]MEB8433542.1 helix-turn-helix transcriptional regulator [Cocleimonas sp. KMM 6892]MEC4716353.1 helix-turn-helix transcriptional regulator [Cocleimonas sp. KMM 6895]MEC4745754.1 helix-turn-helix transcriptional regulator [Cocleimonas sp. KMM 6896]